jgi:hypothetical protein
MLAGWWLYRINATHLRSSLPRLTHIVMAQ